MNIGDAIADAATALNDAGIAEPRREASSILGYVIKQDAAFLIAHSDDHLAAPYKMMFDACVRRRSKHEPLQYITGRQEFYGLDLSVTPDVLIPRPETEILVEKAIEILAEVESPRFCEVGVGSGCISVAILDAVKKATALSVDISPAALLIARRNAEKNGVADRLSLLQADVFAGVVGTFDMIVSNPPYVPADQLASLQPEVRDFEPRAALDGGERGLDIVERIVAEAPKFLAPRGHLLLEIGFDQAKTVIGLFDPAVWQTPESFPDLQQIPRVIDASLR